MTTRSPALAGSLAIFAAVVLPGMVLPRVAPALAAAAAVAGPVGEVLAQQKISALEGGFTGDLDAGDHFGTSLAYLGDLDGDGNADLAVGAQLDDDGGIDRGAVWILFLDTDGKVKDQQKISFTAGGFTGVLDDDDWFGSSVAAVGDLDGNGVTDLAVGARLDDDGGAAYGAVWVLFLESDGTVGFHQKISATEGGFTGSLAEFDFFGASLAFLGDLDGDGTVELAVGAPEADDGGSSRGAVWVLSLSSDGTVDSHVRISDTVGGFTGVLDDVDYFGRSLGAPGDLDGDGVADLVVGAPGDDDGGGEVGAAWVLFLAADGSVDSHVKISATAGGFAGALDPNDNFGEALASPGDLDCDGTPDLAVGTRRDDDGEPDAGAVWILFLEPDGSVAGHRKISATEGGFSGALDSGNWFGSAVATLGDLDGDGNADLAVGASLDHDGGDNTGAVWNLFLDGEGCSGDTEIFADGFETGGTDAWDVVVD